MDIPNERSNRKATSATPSPPGATLSLTEGDLITGTDNASAIGTLVERTTRFTMLVHLPREPGYGVTARTKNGPALAGYGAISMKNALATRMSTLPATVIAERVGWTGSITWFRDNVRRLRPEHRPVDPADRLIWLPGDVAQCDLWFPPRKIGLEDGSKTLIPTRQTTDLLLGMWELLEQLGRVPRRLIWDNESGIGRGTRHADGVGAFSGTLATTLQRLKPCDPESKGIVERRNGFFETSFMPGRDFASPADFDAQFTDWLVKANTRIVRTWGNCLR